MFSNRVEITLSSILGTITLNDDPINYDKSEFDLKRSEATHGIFLKQINNLEFTGKAKQYLLNLLKLKGPHAKCELTRKEQHPTTDDWFLKARGYLDFYNRDIKDNKLIIDFVEGGLRETLVSQMREKFELNRTTDINSKPIPALKTDVLSNNGRELFLLSKFKAENQEFKFQSGNWNDTGDQRESFTPFPFSVTANANADPLSIQSPQDTRKQEDRWDPSLLNMFFATADRRRGIVKMEMNYSFKIKSFNHQNASNVTIQIVLDTFQGGFNNLPLERVTGGRTVIRSLPFPSLSDPSTFDVISGNFSKEIQPEEGQSFALGIWVSGEYGNFPNDGNLTIQYENFTGSLLWPEDSFFKRTNNPCLTAYNVGKRLSEIYTGKNSFESHILDGTDDTYLKDNNHELIFAPGGWLRNLKKEEEVTDEFGNVTGIIEREWPMEINFEDFYKSIHAILPVGYGISINGNEQKIVFEDLRYFFQRTVVGSLGKIQIKGRSTAAEYCYQSLKFGYTKGGDYEQPLGLDEYNTQTNSRTPLTGTDNEYEALGPSRTDSYGAEDARRKQYEDTADEDTPYDKDNFLFDAKLITRSNKANYYEPRLWQDDFETAPTGVYSPETAFNLNLSPGRNRLRHSYFWISSIIMLQDENIQFVNNTKGNSNLTTKKAGERALKESEENVPINVFDNPIFEPEWIDAEASFDQNILEKLLGNTLIDGRLINNYYGLWEFINEQNRKEYAYIFSVKSKDKFTYKLLKA